MNTKIGQPSFKKNGDVEKLMYLELRGNSYGIFRERFKVTKYNHFLKWPVFGRSVGTPVKNHHFLKGPVFVT